MITRYYLVKNSNRYYDHVLRVRGDKYHDRTIDSKYPAGVNPGWKPTSLDQIKAKIRDKHAQEITEQELFLILL